MSETLSIPSSKCTNASFSARVSLRGLMGVDDVRAVSCLEAIFSYALKTSHQPGQTSMPRELVEFLRYTQPYLPHSSISRRMLVTSSCVALACLSLSSASSSPVLACGLRSGLVIVFAMMHPYPRLTESQDGTLVSPCSDSRCASSSQYPGHPRSHAALLSHMNLSYTSHMHLPDVEHRSQSASMIFVLVRTKRPNSESFIAARSYARYATPMVVVLGLTILNQLSGSQGCHRGLKGGRNSLQTLSEIQIPQGARVVCNLGYLFGLFSFDYQRTYRNGSAAVKCLASKTPTMRFSPKNVWLLKKGQNQCQNVDGKLFLPR